MKFVFKNVSYPNVFTSSNLKKVRITGDADLVDTIKVSLDEIDGTLTGLILAKD